MRSPSNLPFWPADAQAGKPIHPAVFKHRVTCNRCGKGFLFWHRHDGEWRLHHWANLDDGKGPHYVLHRCGFDSAGQALSTPERPQ